MQHVLGSFALVHGPQTYFLFFFSSIPPSQKSQGGKIMIVMIMILANILLSALFQALFTEPSLAITITLGSRQ